MYPFGPCHFCRRSTIHFWRASPLEAVHLALRDHLEHRGQRRLGQPHGAFLLGLGDVEVSRVEGAGGPDIEAVPPPIRVSERGT